MSFDGRSTVTKNYENAQSISSWSLLLDALSNYAAKENITKTKDKAGLVRVIANNKVINEILVKHLNSYDKEFKEKTAKNNSKAEASLLAAKKISRNINYNTEYIQCIKELEKAAACATADAKCLKDINNLLKKVIPEKNRRPPVKAPSISSSPDFPGASKKLHIEYSESRGRHVICNEDVAEGELLFVEKPPASLAILGMDYKFCADCCRRLSATLVSCENCNEVLYCSVECRSAFLPYHKWECRYVAYLQPLGIAHPALRSLMVKSHDPDSRYKDIANLQYHWDESPKRNFNFVVTAHLLTLYLKLKTSYFPPTATSKDFLETTETLLEHMLRLIVNAQGVVYTCLAPMEVANSLVMTAESRRVATGIYPSTAMMNHSCIPNVSTSYYGNVMVVRADRNLKKGEQVFNCYGPNYARMPRMERQKILLDQYNFLCDCDACNMPYDVTELLDAFKCPKCGGPLLFSKNCCAACNQSCSIPHASIAAKRKAESMLEKYLVHCCLDGVEWRMGCNNRKYVLLFKMEIPVPLCDLLTAWRSARRALFCYNSILVRLVDAISLEMAMNQRWGRSVKLSSSIVTALKGINGESSSYAVDELAKLAALCEQAASENGISASCAREFREKSKYYKKQADAQSLLIYGHVYEDTDMILD